MAFARSSGVAIWPQSRVPCASTGREGIRLPGSQRCCSSVVEHSLGKGEVVSSIMTSSTIGERVAAGRDYGISWPAASREDMGLICWGGTLVMRGADEGG